MGKQRTLHIVCWSLLIFLADNGLAAFAASDTGSEQLATERLKAGTQAKRRDKTTTDSLATTESLAQAISNANGRVRNHPEQREAAARQLDEFTCAWIATRRARFTAKNGELKTDGDSTTKSHSFAWMIDDPIDWERQGGRDVLVPGLATATFLKVLQGSRYALDKPAASMNDIMNQYAGFLRGRNKENLQSIVDALDYYKRHFKEQPVAERNGGYFQFRAFWNEMQGFHCGKVYSRQAAMEKQKVKDYRKKFTEERKQVEADPFMRRVGMRMDESEGYYSYAPRPEFFVEQFGAFVSEDARTYLKLEAEVIARPVGEDGGLMIGWDDLARLIRKREQFELQYPSSVLTPRAKKEGDRFMDFLLNGIDNTRIWDDRDGAVEPKLKKAYEEYVKAYPDSPSGRRIAAHYALLKRFNFHWSPDLDKEFKKQFGQYPMQPIQAVRVQE